MTTLDELTFPAPKRGGMNRLDDLLRSGYTIDDINSFDMYGARAFRVARDVRAMVESGMTLSTAVRLAAKKSCVNKSSVYRWLGKDYVKKTRESLRERVTRLLKANASVELLHNIYDVPKATLYRWKNSIK
jgi:hypothetical protein